MKFPFKKKDSARALGMMGFVDYNRLSAYLRTIRNGEEMELIVRKKISWDISHMRRFFEGPAVDFVRDRFADIGVAMGRGDVREALKRKFLGFTAEHGIETPVSTTSLTRPKWIVFLRDINDYCMSEFGCGLPETDNTDVGD